MSDPASPFRPWALLLRTPGLGPVSLREALHAAGSVDALCGASAWQLRHWGVPDAGISFLHQRQHPEVDADLDWLARTGATLLPCTSPDYPELLATLRDAPVALYVRGDTALLKRPQLAIVGSRSPTAAGRRFAAQLARSLSELGLVITSGLARGVDTAAHEGALQAKGLTVAVCGTGLDRCYPAHNADLARRIGDRGALVCEYPPGTGPRAHHFPQRNRIIAGLCVGTIVVEAAVGSGSLITANRAGEAGRDVYAVPGSPLNPLAAGCLELLKDGAHLVCNVEDVVAELPAEVRKNMSADQVLAADISKDNAACRLDKEYEMLLDALGFEPASIDDLVDRTGIAPGSVASMLLILKLKGRVEARPGALFNRIE